MSQGINNDDVLQELVNQFSDPMAFLRELIQNSIDAGSGEIEVELGWASGQMTISVQDFGEGMTRQIIETKLVRLFASTKDQDFTKIGRFGIGFVSVFAIKPEAVCVDTGRTGESWRVLFKADRTYELLSVKEVFEGTRVRSFKRCTEEEFRDYERRGRETLRRWCRHVSIPVRYQGEEINEAFEVSGALVARYEEPGTRIVAALVDEPKEALASYFNRGLTLKDEEPSERAHVRFLVDSRYLEHTLTRDQVLRDDHYHKAMRLVERLVERELYGALPGAAQAAGQAGDWPRYERLMKVLVALVRAQRVDGRAVEKQELVRALDARGQACLVSAAAVKKAHKKGKAVMGAPESALSRALAAREYTVVCVDSAAALAQVELPEASERFVYLEVARREDAARLLSAVAVLGRALGMSAEAEACVVRWERDAKRVAPAVVVTEAAGRAEEASALWGRQQARRFEGATLAALVEDAPGMEVVWGLSAAGQPVLAALMAWRMALLHHGLVQAHDEALTRAAARMMGEEAGHV